jgi:hypothetical protein
VRTHVHVQLATGGLSYYLGPRTQAWLSPRPKSLRERGLTPPAGRPWRPACCRASPPAGRGLCAVPPPDKLCAVCPPGRGCLSPFCKSSSAAGRLCAGPALRATPMGAPGPQKLRACCCRRLPARGRLPRAARPCVSPRRPPMPLGSHRGPRAPPGNKRGHTACSTDRHLHIVAVITASRCWAGLGFAWEPPFLPTPRSPLRRVGP